MGKLLWILESIKEEVIEKGGKQGIRYIGAGKFRDALERNGVDILAYDNSLKQYHAEASLDVIQKIAYLDFVAAQSNQSQADMQNALMKARPQLALIIFEVRMFIIMVQEFRLES